jgi:redox-sensitive bicupin YhaK (pirin superfamily)
VSFQYHLDMSYHECPEAQTRRSMEDPEALELIVVPRTRDLGGFEVRRALPTRERRMVGPFIFLDQMGPSELVIGQGLDVRPHPHIGLATVTYLFEGEITHRDSLGNTQLIRPGAVNWMTAGRGIAHSERSPDITRRTGGRLSGIQAWVALPQDQEECAPDFVHHPESSLPMIEDDGVTMRVLAGSFHGLDSPVPVLTETLYVDVFLKSQSRLPVESVHEERAMYLAFGTIWIDGVEHRAGTLLVLRPGADVTVEAISDARFLVLGGEPMDGPRHIWWNFVSSRKDRIEQAKADWQAGRFDPVVDDPNNLPVPGSS